MADYNKERTRQLEEEKRKTREMRIRMMRRQRLLVLIAFFLILAVIIIVIAAGTCGGGTEGNGQEAGSKAAAGSETAVTGSGEGSPEASSESQSLTDTAALDTSHAQETPAETQAASAIPETAAPETTAVTTAETVPPTDSEGHYNDRIYIPSWVTQEWLTPSQYNRSQEALTTVNNIVIHYVGNPGSSAQGNRDYFESLSDPAANPTGHGASSHFIVGLQGEVIQCVPVAEVAFANYPRNYDTVSIETCHPDETGKFNDVTYNSLVRLTAYLCEQLGVPTSNLIRHYDVTGKYCPLYYVEHPEAWEQFKEDVQNYINAHPDIRNEMP